ncbi:MAG TPA: nitroreductase family protein [Ktedonobacteraceae bacterium]|nr:nitroreductase family protein [Ktedonobacteraceae bacterium]
MSHLNLTPDELLATTRSVRKRLDFSRSVEPEVIRECLELAVQAPTGGNRQGWQFIVVTDAEQRQKLGAIYHSTSCIASRRQGMMRVRLLPNR